MQGLGVVSSINVLSSKLYETVHTMISTWRTRGTPLHRICEPSLLTCAKCHQITYRVCTSLKAYQFYVFTRRRYRDYICVACCDEMPVRVINALFEGEGVETLEILQEEHEMITRMYEQWYRNKSSIPLSLAVQLRSSNMKLERARVDNRQSSRLPLEGNNHNGARFQSISTEAEINFKSYIHLQQRYKNLQKEVENISSNLDETKRELVQKGKLNDLNMRRIANLENHQRILREFIQDQKKLLALREKEEGEMHVDGSQTRYIRPDVRLKSDMSGSDEDMSVYKTPTIEAAYVKGEGLKREIALLDACISELSTNVSHSKEKDETSVTTLVPLSTIDDDTEYEDMTLAPLSTIADDTECEDMCTEDDSLDILDICIRRSIDYNNNDDTSGQINDDVSKQHVSSVNISKSDTNKSHDDCNRVKAERLCHFLDYNEILVRRCHALCMTEKGLKQDDDYFIEEDYEFDQSITDDNISPKRNLTG